MCMNCFTNAEFVAANVALAGWVLKAPVHRMLADVGLADAPDPVKIDVRSVGYLRSLDLDPVEVLGQARVDRADEWVPQPARELRWSSSASPIGSQSLLAPQ